MARWKGWLSPAELEEANEHLARLIELLRHDAGTPVAKRRLHEFTLVVAPVVNPTVTKAGSAGRKVRR